MYVDDAIRTGWGDKCYDYIIKFEKAFKVYIGGNFAKATSSCTGALHMALSAIDVGPDDEVIVPDITWIASVAPITYLGAKPVFIDILEDTWCLDPAKIEAAITSKTKAIIPVHLYGNLCEMDEILAIAKKHNLIVIEDAAEAIGSEYKGKKAGSIGDFGTFSFHGTKTITTGEGGMLIVKNEAMLKKIEVLANHGRDSKIPKQFWCEKIGYKYNISNMQAALGFGQMQRVDELVEKKRQIFYWYQAALTGINGTAMNPEKEGTKNSYWMPTVVFDQDIDQKKLIDILQENNIDARVFFYPVSLFPMFDERRENTVSYKIYKNAINLPSYHDINQDEVKRVADCIRKFLLR